MPCQLWHPKKENNSIVLEHFAAVDTAGIAFNKMKKKEKCER